MYENEVHHTFNRVRGDGGRHLAGVTAEGLGKRFPDLWAIRDLDLDVPRGTVLALLGHNGAGKTTTIRMLTTLSRPTSGRATVAGFDVAENPAAVRQRIGVASQQATVDGLMSARLNLELIGRLHHVPKRLARGRADELLERFGLAEASGRLVKTFSGGMRRRLDLAASLVSAPDVLFLDEPTTGLDPRSRGELWEMLRELVRDGTTLVLTTQYLDEADRLADDVVVLDHGQVVAQGSPDQLKARIGGDRVVVWVPAAGAVQAAANALRTFASDEPAADTDDRTVTATVHEGVRLVEVVRVLDDAGIDVLDINRRKATLDDVFLSLTTPIPATQEATA